MTGLELVTVPIEKPEGVNLILHQSHFGADL